MTISIIISSLLILFGGFITVFNGVVFIRQIRNLESPSPAPLMGGLLFSLGLYFFPSFDFSYFSILPIFLDYGCFIYTAGAITYLVKDSFETSKRNQIHHFCLKEPSQDTDIRLYKKSIAVITFQSETTILSCSCDWIKKDNIISLECGDLSYKINMTSEHPYVSTEKITETKFSLLNKRLKVG